MHAFIIRPFGTKSGIDFEKVESDLIDPVLDELEIVGRTTGEIVAAGNIRVSMFERLLTAGVVIADISIHNANVYYELGIRHALRARSTVLIRSRGDEVPFDLETDRYLAYDANDPATSRDELRAALKATLRSDATDSPVHLLVPRLSDLDVEDLAPVPPDFSDAVDEARGQRDGAMLGLLGDELRGVGWEVAGCRHVGRAQSDLRLFSAAQGTWERVLQLVPGDVEAAERLGTIYQRLGKVQTSANVLQRLLDHGDIATTRRAEAYALVGSNQKTLWRQSFAKTPDEGRRAHALESRYLRMARESYVAGFAADLNHYYSGINALAMTVLTLDLAAVEPESWSHTFESDDEAAQARGKLERERDRLAMTVESSLAAARARDPNDAWLVASQADMRFLTSDSEGRVSRAYRAVREAFDERGADFHGDSVARQLRLFLGLGLRVDTCRAALRALGVPDEEPPASSTPRIIIFTGHRVDAADRAEPRFPRTPEAEAAARAAIAKEVDAILDEAESSVVAAEGDRAAIDVQGVAGGASGGDLLFHEICAERDIPTTLSIALPPDRYRAASVDEAGGDWGRRFEELHAGLESADPSAVRVLAPDAVQPSWLDGSADIWTRNNTWILNLALARRGVSRVTLVAFWNGQGGDGPGGTADMIRLAERHGVRVVRIDSAKVLGTE